MHQPKLIASGIYSRLTIPLVAAHNPLTIGAHAQVVFQFLLLTLLTIASAARMVAQPGAQGDRIWLRNAFYGEAHTFDACGAHQPGNGQHHNHATPTCLRAQLNDNIEVLRTNRDGNVYREKAGGWTHSPILGWSYDGYPVYGPYGYSDARNAGSAIRRIRSSFKLRNMTARTSLPAWALPLHTGFTQTLTAAQYGPPLDSQFPLGRYLEDFEYDATSGDLDVHNGRFTVTPEYPQGTYAYYLTIDENGAPAFPYTIGLQYYGVYTAPNTTSVPDAAQDYIREGALAQAASMTALLRSWSTQFARQAAQVVLGYAPDEAPKTTWPVDAPAALRLSGSVTVPTNGEIQRVRYTDSMIYVNAAGLAGYTMGPWYDPAFTGAIFGNLPSNQNLQVGITRTPREATTKTLTSGGAIGLLVNGVPIFNALDGASYSNARGADVGGGIVNQTAIHTSTASGERGPLAAGSLVSAYSLFGVNLAGATVTVRDAANVTHNAEVFFTNANQVNYRMPAQAVAGFGVATFTANGRSTTANLQITSVYPSLFIGTADGRAAAQFIRVRNGAQTVEPIDVPVDLGPAADQVVLVLYATGLNGQSGTTATIGGTGTTPLYAGPQGQFAGLDQVNLLLPRTLAGRGKVEVTITTAGKKSNPVFIEVR